MLYLLTLLASDITPDLLIESSATESVTSAAANYDWFGTIMNNLTVPIIAAIGGVFVLIIQKFGNKITKSIIAKNELSSMEKKNNVRNQIIASISTMVEAAVASNMEIAEQMKSNGQKLTDEQIRELNESAKKLTYAALPPSITEDGGVLLELIGSKAKLDTIIDNLIEKYVYEYKIKAAAAEKQKNSKRKSTTTTNNRTNVNTNYKKFK